MNFNKAKRIIIASISLTVLLASVSSCGQQKTDEKVLHIYNWSEYIPQEVYDKFEEETGIKVVESTFSSNEEMLAKLTAGGTTQYDIITASNYVIPSMREQGMLMELDKNNIPNFSNVYDIYKGLEFDAENKWSIPYMATMTVVAVNKPLCKELGVEIKSLNDLNNEKLNQNIVAVDDCRELVGIALKAEGKNPDSKDEAEIMSVEPWLSKLSENIKIYDSDTAFSPLATNEVAAGIVYNMDLALAISENPDIDVAYTTEPCSLSIDNFVITSTSQMKSEAEQFINFIHEPEIYKMCLEAYPALSMNKAGFDLMDDDFKNNAGANPDVNEIKRAHIIDSVDDAATYYDAVYSTMKQ